MLAMGLLALGMCFAAAGEAGIPVCPAVDAEAGAATTAGEDNGLTIDGGEETLPEAWREIGAPEDGEEAWREIGAPEAANGEDEAALEA